MTALKYGMGLLMLCMGIIACRDTGKKEPAPSFQKEDPVLTNWESSNRQEPDTAMAPEQVLENYYRALNQKDYPKAYGFWEGDGKASGKTLNEFEAEFRNMQQSKINISDKISLNTASDTIYAEIPAQVESISKTGKRELFGGHFVLRKPVLSSSSDDTASSWKIFSVSIQKQ